MGIGLANELDEESAEAVDEQERADEKARPAAGIGSPEQIPEDHEQQQALEPRLVELARVARRSIGELHLAIDHPAGRLLGKAYRPGNARRRPPQFVVHEVREPAEEQA